MNALPSIFISHGSPMHAIQAGNAGLAWARLGQTLPRPKAILMMSAHWETNVPMLTGSSQPDTIHDFGGFPEELYRIRYPAPGSNELAQQSRQLLTQAGITAAIDGCRGLDHGAWAPLLHMYPQADIPVVQISVQPALGPRHHYEIGRALAPLGDQEILLIGSGHMTHNLRDWMLGRPGATPVAYAREFQAWIRQHIAEQDTDALLDYRTQAPHAVRAHPTDEHFLPLFFALGAAGHQATATWINDDIEHGVLAMDSGVFTRDGSPAP